MSLSEKLSKFVYFEVDNVIDDTTNVLSVLIDEGVSDELIEKALTVAQREKISPEKYIFPERAPRGGWPIHDKKHAMIALRYIETGFRVPKSKADRKFIIDAIDKAWGKDPEVKAKIDQLRGKKAKAA